MYECASTTEAGFIQYLLLFRSAHLRPVDKFLQVFMHTFDYTHSIRMFFPAAPQGRMWYGSTCFEYSRGSLSSLLCRCSTRVLTSLGTCPTQNLYPRFNKCGTQFAVVAIHATFNTGLMPKNVKYSRLTSTGNLTSGNTAAVMIQVWMQALSETRNPARTGIPIT